MTTHSSPLPVPYIPPYVEEELLFSWVARLHFLNARSNSRETLMDFFGSRTAIPSADLPCRLQAFVDRTAAFGPFQTVAQVLGSATLFPYHRLFLSAQQSERAAAMMAGTRGEGLKIAMGLVANGFSASTTLKTCEKCSRMHWETSGCMPWLRVHQLPGVHVCPIHKEWLRIHVMQSEQTHRQLLRMPVKALNATEGSGDPKSCLLKLALLSNEAIRTLADPPSPTARQRAYLEGLRVNGLAHRGKARWSDLSQAVLESYASFDGMPLKQRLLSSTNSPLRWTRDLCQRPDRSMHPICHLLLIGFLFGSVKRFLSVAADGCVESTMLFAGGGMHIAPEKLKQHQPDFAFDNAMSCRAVALQTGLSVTTVVSRRRALGIPISERRKVITPDKLAEVKKLVLNGQPVQEISRTLQISASSVYRALAALPIIASERRSQACLAEQTRHRERWAHEQSANKAAGTNELRLVAGATYAWLYRNDREWLKSNKPSIKSGAHSGSGPSLRVDWHLRDCQLSDAVSAEARKVRASKGGRRQSATALLRVAAGGTSARRNLQKLPILAWTLADQVETDDEFVCRRKREALLTLESQGHESPAAWRIDRAACIRKQRR